MNKWVEEFAEGYKKAYTLATHKLVPDCFTLNGCVQEGEFSKPQFDVVGAIMEFESEGLPEEELVELFQHLVDTGLVWHLQGTYGRIAADMIDAGLVVQR